MMSTGGRLMERGVVMARIASFCLALRRGSSCSSHCLWHRRENLHGLQTHKCALPTQLPLTEIETSVSELELLDKQILFMSCVILGTKDFLSYNSQENSENCEIYTQYSKMLTIARNKLRIVRYKLRFPKCQFVIV